MNFAFILAPPSRRVVGTLVVTSYTGIERVAALEFDRNDIAIRAVVRALGTLVNVNTAHDHVSINESSCWLGPHTLCLTREPEANDTNHDSPITLHRVLLVLQPDLCRE